MQNKKDIEIQPGFEPGSSECWSDALTNRATELWQMVYIDRHTVQFSARISGSQSWVTTLHDKYMYYRLLQPVNWVLAAVTLDVPLEPPLGANFQRKDIQVFLPAPQKYIHFQHLPQRLLVSHDYQ